MKILDGLEQISQLTEQQKQDFEVYCKDKMQNHLLPLFADLSLAMTLGGTIILLIISLLQPGGAVHILNYVYIVMLFGIAAAHFNKNIRREAPLLVYCLFFTVSLFSYLNYMSVGGGSDPIFGLFFYLSSLGFITLSLLHTSVIHSINMLFLVVTTLLVTGTAGLSSALSSIFSDWFFIMCLFIAPLSAVFNRWLFRNIVALQYMLKEKNDLLKDTLQSLKTTEAIVVKQQRHEALSHMAKGILHEIMNPVNCSTQAISYAKGINNNPELGEALDDAMLNQQRIANIIADLRAYSAPSSENIFAQLDLRELIDQSIKFCRNELGEIDVSVSIEEGVSLYGSASELQQVCVNLLLNAVTALQQKVKANTARIHISHQAMDGCMNIYFVDNGVGIDEENKKYLTEPFYSTNDGANKMGLGLSICQTIMRRHQGDMNFTSSSEEGAQVTLSFPHSKLTD